MSWKASGNRNCFSTIAHAQRTEGPSPQRRSSSGQAAWDIPIQESSTLPAPSEDVFPAELHTSEEYKIPEDGKEQITDIPSAARDDFAAGAGVFDADCG
jgi:hypothetical protein